MNQKGYFVMSLFDRCQLTIIFLLQLLLSCGFYQVVPALVALDICGGSLRWCTKFSFRSDLYHSSSSYLCPVQFSQYLLDDSNFKR